MLVEVGNLQHTAHPPLSSVQRSAAALCPEPKRCRGLPQARLGPAASPAQPARTDKRQRKAQCEIRVSARLSSRTYATSSLQNSGGGRCTGSRVYSSSNLSSTVVSGRAATSNSRMRCRSVEPKASLHSLPSRCGPVPCMRCAPTNMCARARFGPFVHVHGRASVCMCMHRVVDTSGATAYDLMQPLRWSFRARREGAAANASLAASCSTCRAFAHAT